jgi:hypothetical protein
VRGQRHAPAAPYPRERPGTRFTGGLGGPQGRSRRVQKISPTPGFDPRTVQPVGSRYTDYAIRPTADCVFMIIYVLCLTEYITLSYCITQRDGTYQNKKQLKLATCNTTVIFTETKD